MTFESSVCYIYAVILVADAAMNFVPGLTDESGLAFGVFAQDPFEEALYLAAAI